MAKVSQTTARTELDFSGPTFNVLVGKEPASIQTFTVHTKILTKRSKFLRAARKPEWLNGDTQKPVDLTGEDAEVFQAYLSCVYCGLETLLEDRNAFMNEVWDGVTEYSTLQVKSIRHDVDELELSEYFQEFIKHDVIQMSKVNSTCSRDATIKFATADAARGALKARNGSVFMGECLKVKYAKHRGRRCEEEQERRYQLADPRYEALIRLYVLADKLQDVMTVNMVINAVWRLYKLSKVHPGPGPMSLLYESVVEQDLLRKLLFDLWVGKMDTHYGHKRLKSGDYPYAFLQEVAATLVENFVVHQGDQADLWYENMVHVEGTYDAKSEDLCGYHQHDEEHPICVPGSEDAVCCKAKP